MRTGPLACLLLLFAMAAVAPTPRAQSTCFGTVSQGRLENGVALPGSGANFGAYSAAASVLRRTHVHTRVAQIVVAAYAALEKSAPGKVFVYGETGWPSGGRFRPHRTHQNGLSVDFMVPVLDATGRSVPLPGNAMNRYGYDLEFDAGGTLQTLKIDFAALAEHLFQLHVAAQARAAGIALVIFDPRYLDALFATPRGPFLRQHVKFLQGPAWWRHDEHYHVDFSVPCKPMSD
jgi:penicillin-insensitive murein endopeptidase